MEFYLTIYLPKMLLNVMLYAEINSWLDSVSGLLTGSDIWLSTPSMLFFRSNCVCCGLSMKFFQCPLVIFTCRSICDCWMSQGLSNTDQTERNREWEREREREREREQTEKHRYNMMTAKCWKIKWLHQCPNLTVCPKWKIKQSNSVQQWKYTILSSFF